MMTEPSNTDKVIIEFEPGGVTKMDSGCLTDILNEASEHGKVLGCTLIHADGITSDINHFLEFLEDNSGPKAGKC